MEAYTVYAQRMMVWLCNNPGPKAIGTTLLKICSRGWQYAAAIATGEVLSNNPPKINYYDTYLCKVGTVWLGTIFIQEWVYQCKSMAEYVPGVVLFMDPLVNEWVVKESMGVVESDLSN